MTSERQLKNRILFLVQFAILAAIEAIVCFTVLGSIPIGPLVATLAIVPVSITAILLGTWAGTAMGFLTGLFSFLYWSFYAPSPMSFVFTPLYGVGDIQGNAWSLVICFVPRILAGTVTGLCFTLFSRVCAKWRYKDGFVYGLSGVLGSLTNTLLVMGGIYLFFGEPYAAAMEVSYALLLGVIGMTIVTNGLLEAVIGGVACYAVCRPIRRYILKHPIAG